jgi:tRNA-2-methylthio-N6-dimethylallyladenosine synthase
MQTFSYKILTFGCQMNKSDSERIDSILQGINFVSSDDETEIDLIVLNTCSLRQKAEDRIYGFCNKFHKMREGREKQLIIAVTGCMPGRDHDGSIRRRLPMVDLFFDIQRITELPQMLSEVNKNIPSNNPLDDHYLHITPDYKNTYQSFIPIQTGCNKFCTFCVVPFARGREVNRPLGNLLDEIKLFADKGGKEITLLGQTVNSYLIDDRSELSKGNPYSVDFACLLWEANQIDGIERIHFTAPHPRDIQD